MRSSFPHLLLIAVINDIFPLKNIFPNAQLNSFLYEIWKKKVINKDVSTTALSNFFFYLNLIGTLPSKFGWESRLVFYSPSSLPDVTYLRSALDKNALWHRISYKVSPVFTDDRRKSLTYSSC